MIAFLYARVSVVKESMEAPRAELDVTHGVRDIFVSEVLLNQAQIGPPLCQVVAAGVPKAMRVYVEFAQARPRRNPVKHELHRPRPQSPPTFRGKHKFGRKGPILTKSTQSPNFHPSQPMIAREGTFKPMDMKDPLLEVELLPAGLQALRNAQSVREQDQDQGRVACSVSVASRRLNQLIDFHFEQMLPSSSPAANCSPYGDWNHVAHMWKTCEKAAYRMRD